MFLTITLKGKQYPARFTLRTAILAAERRGGSLSKLLRNEKQAEFIEDMPWLAIEMIKAGAAIREKETGIITKDVPELEDLLDTVDYADLLDLQKQILDVINKDQPTVTAEGKEKNAEATPEN